MANGSGNCPPECEVKLGNYKERLDKHDKILAADYKHWEDEMSERPKTRTLVWIFGPILTAMLFFIGWSFSSIKDGQVQAIDTLEAHQRVSLEHLEASQDKIEKKLEVVREMQIKVMSKIGLDNGTGP